MGFRTSFRTALLAAADSSLSEAIHRHLAAYYQRKLDEDGGLNDAEVRERTWHTAYHETYFAPGDALTRLLPASLDALSDRRDGDLKAIADLVDERRSVLGEYAAEAAFYRGLYARRHRHESRGYRQTAQSSFETVYDARLSNPLMRSVTAHLLGRILAEKMSTRARRRAEEMIRESVDLLRTQLGDEAQEVYALNSLADVLVKLGGAARLTEADAVLDQAWRLRAHAAAETGGVIRHTRGRLRIRQGRFAEADAELQASYKELLELHDVRGAAMVLRSRAEIAEREKDVARACGLYRELWILNRKAGFARDAKKTEDKLDKLCGDWR